MKGDADLFERRLELSALFLLCALGSIAVAVTKRAPGMWIPSVPLTFAGILGFIVGLRGRALSIHPLTLHLSRRRTRPTPDRRGKEFATPLPWPYAALRPWLSSVTIAIAIAIVWSSAPAWVTACAGGALLLAVPRGNSAS